MTLVCSVALGSAVVLELLQKLTPDRHARLLDASEKVVGGLLGILLASIALRLIERWRLHLISNGSCGLGSCPIVP